METLTFRTRHEYSSVPVGIEVPISLAVGSGPCVRLRAKLDTGASFCVFQRQYAEQLGIDVESGHYLRVATAAGGFGVYGHSVNVLCFEWEFESMVYFAEAPEFRRNVVGRSGWLQHFRLGLIDRDSTLFLSRRDD